MFFLYDVCMDHPNKTLLKGSLQLFLPLKTVINPIIASVVKCDLIPTQGSHSLPQSLPPTICHTSYAF